MREWTIAHCRRANPSERLQQQSAYTLSPAANLHGAAGMASLFSTALRRVLAGLGCRQRQRSEEHTSELQSPCNLVCRLLLEKKKKKQLYHIYILIVRWYAVINVTVYLTYSD